jgi:N-acetylglucosaminyl-diphospho-decaprenol L-rhamnosyltransferase
MGQAQGLKVLIVIVNYRTADLVIDCLGSLEDEVRALEGCQVRVVVADNASEDNSVPRLRTAIRDQGWSDWASIQPLERNGGFAFGNNAAIRPALDSDVAPDYFWLLNPDTVIRSGALAAMITFLETHPEIGIGGCRLEDPDGSPQRSAFRFPSVLGSLEDGMRLGLVSRLLEQWVFAPPVQNEPGPTDCVAGASMVIRRAVFEAIGLLDENYFMYFEEVDFCLRARRAGWSCWYIPSSHVVHLVGQSSGITGKDSHRKRLPRYWFEARRYYFRKHLGRLGTLVADLAWSLGFLSFRIRQQLQGKPDREPPYLLRDFVRYNFSPWPRCLR